MTVNRALILQSTPQFITVFYVIGFSRVHHSGSLWSYTSHAWLFPNEKIGGFLALNGPVGSGASRARETVMAYISDILLGEELWINGTTGCEYPKPWEVYPELRYNISNIVYTGPPKRPLVSYTGSFHHPLYGRALVELSNSSSSQLQLLIGEVYSAQLYMLDAIDQFLLAFDGLYKFLTYSDDKQRIGSVVFNVTQAFGDDQYVARSFVLGFLSGDQYDFHRDLNYYNLPSIEVNSSQSNTQTIFLLLTSFVVLVRHLL